MSKRRFCRQFRGLPEKPLSPWLVAAGATVTVVGYFAAHGIGSILPPASIGDVLGAPSTVALTRGRYQVAQAERTSRKRYHTVTTNRTANLVQAKKKIETLPPNSGRVVAKVTPPPAGGKKPVSRTGKPKTPAAQPQPSTVIVSTYQNVSVRFVDPRGHAVGALPIVAHIHYPNGRDEVTPAAATDANGVARFARLGPLPFAVDFDVQSPPGVALASGTAPDTAEKEWRLKDSLAGILTVTEGMGQRIASWDKPQLIGSGIQVASSRPLAFAAPPAKVIQREVVYAYQPTEAITVERTVTDIQVSAPAGSTLTCPAFPPRLASGVTVPEAGNVRIQVPAAALDSGPVPIRVARNLPAGESETVITNYGTDPYATPDQNQATAPPLKLIRVSQWQTAGNVDVMERSDDAFDALGGDGKNGAKKSSDGSEMRDFSRQGVSLKIRNSFAARHPLIERVRITSPQGGQVGGITVGDDVAKLDAALGPPVETLSAADAPVFNAPRSESCQTYLDRGLLVGIHDSKIAYIEFARPGVLLTDGTTAFVPRSPARLFIQSFQGNAHTSLPNAAALRKYLEQVGAVKLVDSADEADLTLDASVTGFDEHRQKFLTNAIPLAYHCSIGAVYTLRNTNNGRYYAHEKRLIERSGADYTAEAAAGTAVLGVAFVKGNDLVKVLAGALGALGIRELQRAVARAINRCPAIASRSLFGHVVNDICRAADVSARVTAIDYDKGTVRLNVGSEAGIHVDSPEKPCEFDLMVEGLSLPSRESGLSADYYTARVVSVDANSCVCQVHHVRRKVDKSREKVDDDIDIGAVRNLPDPSTGLVSGRIAIRFPMLPVITVPDQEGVSNKSERSE